MPTIPDRFTLKLARTEAERIHAALDSPIGPMRALEWLTDDLIDPDYADQEANPRREASFIADELRAMADRIDELATMLPESWKVD